ncbi:acyl-CoA synthetase [Aliidiomarina minuta]|uniref:Acyl-CoA synthetase n=1 Tax=Aliidiomarina minuta TaxID=880057 RepID=A0A432W5X0_9GAMM|nr:AMP-binding protein [Aliidiomarina minuta]RUO25465.1 acyl-CoA synthetase [Aliidiomarina minuta]
MNIAGFVARNARKYPQHQAVVSPESTHSWAQLDQQVNQLARYLSQQHKVQDGDRVALVLPNSYAFIVAYFAVQRAGAIVVPVNVRLAAPELEYILQDSGAATVLTCSMTDEAVKLLQEKGTNAVWLDDVDHLLQDVSNAPVDCDSDDDDLCALLYTSGTTGRPKGVLFNHKALLGVATMFAVEMEYKPESRLLSLMPFTHSAPLNLSLVAGTMVGCTHVVAPTFTPDLLLDLVEKEKTTHFFGAPVAYRLTAQHPDIANRDLSSMTHWIYGGGPLAADHAQLARKAFASDQFYCVYGLTEAGPTGTLLLPEDHATKAGSIGYRAALNTEIRLVDEADKPVETNQPGEIQLTGEGMMLGYWNKPEATAEVLTEDGWLRTGDIAIRDEDGFYWVKDRKKDLIISGGVNVYPREVEDALASHPEVAESAVIGVPHQEWGETVKACVVLKSDLDNAEEALKAHLKPLLADYKVPRLIQVMTELPHNANGKVLKHLLRAEQST